jgi:hypothetical protein
MTTHTCLRIHRTLHAIQLVLFLLIVWRPWHTPQSHPTIEECIGGAIGKTLGKTLHSRRNPRE